MPVGRCAERCGQGYPGRVNGLPYVFQVDPSRDFFDQDGGQALGSQSFVDAKEIDLGHQKVDPVHLHADRNGRQESVQLVVGTATHPNKPV